MGCELLVRIAELPISHHMTGYRERAQEMSQSESKGEHEKERKTILSKMCEKTEYVLIFIAQAIKSYKFSFKIQLFLIDAY